jgi:tetratricopeptide (TPR) repeat protein/DNA-binding winged helix-turn-helix (wHTH) protein
MEQPQRHIYYFADVEVDSLKGCVRRGSKNLERPVRLSQHDFKVFVYLIENRHRLVTKEELLDIYWKDAEVTPDSLVQCVKKIRRAIGDDWRSPRFVETVPKVGYHFIGQLEEGGAATGVSIATEETASIKIEVGQWLNRRILITGGLSIAILAAASAYVYYQSKSTRASQRSLATTLPNPSGKKAVAVLNFENLSGDRDLDWLGAGLADMFTTNFSRSNHLTAINREQVHLLLERNDLKTGDKVSFELGLEVAREGRADAVVLGSFARFGEKLRIDVRLFDARTGQPLQSESLNIDKLDQIPGQIDLLTLKLASQLGAPSTELEHAKGLSQVMTNNLEAYRSYSLALEKAESLHNQEAVALLEKAIALDPQFAMAYARIGYVFAARWNLIDQAKPYLEKAFQLSERLGERDKLLITAWYEIANADYPAAIKSYREITVNYPLEVEGYLRLGHLLAGEGQSAEAIDVYKQGLTIDPEARDIYNELGNLYSSLGKHAEAIAMHQHYVELAPNEANAHDSLGLSLQWAGRYPEAIAEYNRALALNTNFEIALVHLANAYFQTGRYRQALPLYQRYIKIAPSDKERSRGYGCIANIYLRRSRLAEAEQAAKMEVRYQPVEVGTSILLALRRGDIGKAERLVEQSNRFVTPNRGARNTSRSLYYFDGLIALNRGNAEQAIQNFKDALQREPPRWGIDATEDCLARGYLELGRLAEGVKEYERILGANPNYPLAHYHLAQAYERNTERDKASIEYQRFLQAWTDADPDLLEVTKARRFISQR